jgi:drug/metabolite transporter (DMT)-like permease
VADRPEFRVETEASGSAEPGFHPPPQAPPSTPSRPRHHRGGWVAAAVLIVVGVVFLVKNLGWSDWSFDNWWALFILIPALGSFGNAWSSFAAAGRRFDAATGRSVVFGLLFVAITVIFLLDAWDKAWPVILIIIGLGMVFGWRRAQTRDDRGRY